ncbi:amidohydrolase [Pseudooceanicola sp. CBS1P-1]|uniref:Amidohydrolase n=1 Tax=Pseudooceanicola albus TaxID=2692189 RepID=A0A6L7G9C3_9RHOB|nr:MULTISPECIES: amidohydrolase [Pseudooceanicola]MBT9386536.1 amidohydrolase [Pseudooceanicola endophyticus]MXN20569.1 amidohydrolase [Pseudooceanicola albus]
MTAVSAFLADRAPGYSTLRRDLHAHPELGFEEHRTSALVAERLRAAGYTVETGIAGTGVVGTLSRGAGGPVIGLRADMDALPMQEQTNLAHASTAEGKFHGCGHDGHTVSLLATAEALAAEGRFSGTLRVIFQPAEEGLGGGRRMVEEGLFTKLPCDRIFGFHNEPRLPFGTVTTRPGPQMASADRFIIRLTGKGGHAATPHMTRDSALLAAEITVALQGLVSRGIDPLHAAVLSVTQIHVGSADNVIAGEGQISGTVRCLHPEDRAFLEAGIRRIARAQGAAREIDVEVIWEDGYPPLASDAAAAQAAQALLSSAAAPVRFTDMPPIMAAEDFAYMLQACPGAYLFFGMKRDGQDCPMVHSPFYDFDDGLIPVIAESMAALVEAELPV